MPPKKDATAGEALLVGFENKETKLLAAAFLSSTAPDKFDYDIMAKLTGNTAGSLKKMWPPVKKKAIENNASFAAFLGQAGVATAAPAGGEPKPVAAAKAVEKRKAPDEVPEEDVEDGAKDLAPPSAAADKSEGDKSDSKKKAPAAKKEKKAPTQKRVPAVKGKGRPKKAVKKDESASEEEEEEVVKDKSTEDSADGGDGLGDEIENDI